MTADVVRRYARGNPSSHWSAEIEDLLLQDDRARELVRALAPEIGREDLPQWTARKLGDAHKCCMALIGIYRPLRKRSSAQTVRQFASLRLSCLEEVSAAVKRSGLTPPPGPPAGRPRRNTAAKPSTWALLKAAAASEKTLSKALSAAYRAPSPPFCKAQVAAWIARFDAARCDVAWLDLVFTAEQQT